MICIPIVGPTEQQALKDLERSRDLADIVELRMDLMPDADLKNLMQAAGKPVIVTYRNKMDGGQYRGPDEERIASIRKAIDLGAPYIDIETSTPGPLLKSVLENKGQSQVILSHHDFTRTDERIDQIYEIMCEMPADILKIITYAQDINDNLALFRLLYRARKDEKKMIGFCMGEKGEISRILTVHFGGWLTFGSLETGKESAPGQIPARILKEVYRAGAIPPEAKVFGVIGDPINKSMGYLIHNKAFQLTGLPHVYVPFLVKNVQRFFSLFEPYIGGLSVTMPHKEEIGRYLGSISAQAKRIGAVNTVVHENGEWVGYNTDGTGALRALKEKGEVAGKNVVIIGAGGTAKAIGHTLKDAGAHLTLTYHRNRERGQELADQLGARLIHVDAIDKESPDILINCSPAGMTPNVNQTPCPASCLKLGMIVFDSVYNPLETRLVKEAREKGCTVIPGVELFVNQAVEQFEMWTGKTAPIDAMRQVVLDKLKES
ncbi:MAG: shikimate dehydrogenase [Nitrospina sp.]|nr:shikimate dehydrogenase [Nitrospina sp.]